MSISVHHVSKITARATDMEHGNWLELCFESAYGDEATTVLNIYLRTTDGCGVYARALADAINALAPVTDNSDIPF